MDKDTASFGFKDVPADQKAAMVRGVFDSVARKYDVMNDAMSFGVHRIWKDMMIAKANPQPGEALLDVAGGTGDISARFLKRADSVRARRGGAPARAVVCDINAEMLQAGRERELEGDLSWVCGNAECLPYPDQSFDCVTIAFGIRNVTHKDKALKDMHRVLKRGGRFLCLEFSKPTTQALEKLYDTFSFKAIPVMGQMIAGDRESYEYLVESIRRFPDQATFKTMVETAGFKNVSVTNYSGGISALHMGWKV